MALYFVGLGLSDPKDISVKGLELVKKADKIYLESYTGLLQCSVKDLEQEFGVQITPANRELVEKKAEQTILAEAKSGDVVFLVAGDPLVATTHVDLWQRAKKLKIKTAIVHNASIISAVATTGLQIYKFGRTASIPFPEGSYMPETPYDILKENKKAGMHTLLLLDLRPELQKYMTVKEAINYLLSIELKRNEKAFSNDTLCIGCARLGSKDQMIKAGTAKSLGIIDFGKPPHCLIVPGKLHFVEEEVLQQFMVG